MRGVGLAVDIGGTKTLVGVVRDGELADVRRVPTARSAEGIVAQVAGAAAGVRPARVAVAVPGALDRDAGVVHVAANLPFRGFPLGPALADRLGVPVTIEDDANCGLLGEVAEGAARGAADAVYLTVSTGIGLGALSGGRLVVGANGLAGELGHLPVVPGGRRCGCGRDGCLEAYASGRALAELGREALAAGGAAGLRGLADAAAVTGADVVGAAEGGDAECAAAVDRAVGLLTAAVAAVRRVLDPAVVVLGGGLLTGGWLRERLLDAVRAAEATWPAPYTLTAAALGERSVLVGAARLLDGRP